MNSEKLELIQNEYKTGRYAFERGQYRQAIQHLETATGLVEKTTRFGGEVQIWLVTAYEASGEGTKAIALCQTLTGHPHIETRKQARRLLAILEAPQLRMHPEWRVEIPDMTKLDESDAKFRQVSEAPKPKRREPKRPQAEPEPVDLSQVNTKDNQFIWVALGASVLILGGLIWFS
jgi:hypothetical protein